MDPEPSKIETKQPESSQSLIPAYSSEDIERLVYATNLCQNCVRLFAIDNPKPRGPPRDHHATYHSFRQSVESGCMICTKFWKTMNMERKNVLDGYEPKHSMRYRPEDFSHYFYDPGFFSYTDAEGRTGHFLLRRSKYIDLKDSINLQPRHSLGTIQHWLKACTGENHPTCQRYRQPSRSFAKPTRLLYLNPGRPDYVQLITVTTEDAQSARASNHYPYVTLSHRWGEPNPPKLSDAQLADSTHDGGTISIESLEKGYPIMKLPQTFQDAIKIVRACGLTYLWIDSLCIIQVKSSDGSDPASGTGANKGGDTGSDWAIEATKMGDIYAGGVFNIAAAHGKNSNWSIFPHQQGPLAPILRDSSKNHANHDSEEGYNILIEDPHLHFEREIVSSELLSRGWVFQEVLLAPANLFCTQEMMWWSCFESSASQLFPKGIKGIKDDVLVEELFTDILRLQKRNWNYGRNAIRGWMRMICSYSTTSVMHSSDRMVAIAGIANLYALRFPELQCHHSGVWTTEVVRQILWVPDFHKSLPTKRYESKDFYIPSWSPLSFDGLCKPNWRHHMFNDRQETLVKFQALETCNIDKFGRAKDEAGAVLHIQGVLVLMSRYHASIGMISPHENHMDTAERRFRIRGSYDSQKECIRAESSPEDSVYAFACLLVLPIDQEEGPVIIGLLLRRKDDAGKHWVRCGTFRAGGEHKTSLLAEVFGLAKYGWTCKVNENGLGSECIVPTGTVSDLDDVYIV